MRINFFKIIIVAFWLLMNAWLIRYEAFPEKFSEAGGGYRALLQRGPLILDSWMQIESRGTPIGYSHTWIDTNLESSPRLASLSRRSGRSLGDQGVYVVRNQTVLNFKIMGQEQWVGVSADAELDGQYCLQKFSAVMFSSLYTTRIEGKRGRKGFFDITMKTPAAVRQFEMEIPDDVVVYSPMTEMAMKQLAPGKSVRLKTIDPLSLNVAEVKVEAVRRENMVYDGKSYAATVLNISYQGMIVSSWIDDNGRALREETPFGWVMRASTPREILSRRRQSFEGADLFASMAVPSRGQIPNPRECKKLKVRLNGIVFGLDGLESHRQIIKERLNDAVVMELSAQQKPANIAGFRARMPPELRLFLEPSAAVQSDSQEIIRQAEKIVAGSPDSFEAAKSINEWVYRNVVKKPTVSLPSALDVLQRREGDCNEHTYLFVALARAVGLPARINVGIVFAEIEGQPGAFYYHAWPAVFVGEWVEMDPTFGTPLVDATYIRLISGEIIDQMKLLGILGRISVDILEEKMEQVQK